MELDWAYCEFAFARRVHQPAELTACCLYSIFTCPASVVLANVSQFLSSKRVGRMSSSVSSLVYPNLNHWLSASTSRSPCRRARHWRCLDSGWAFTIHRSRSSLVNVEDKDGSTSLSSDASIRTERATLQRLVECNLLIKSVIKHVKLTN